MVYAYASPVEEVVEKLRKISPVLAERFREVLNKRVDELTDSDKKLLILARYLLNPISAGRDIATGARRIAVYVKDWFEKRRYTEIPGVDTPEMRQTYELIKKLYKKGKYDELLKELGIKQRSIEEILLKEYEGMAYIKEIAPEVYNAIIAGIKKIINNDELLVKIEENNLKAKGYVDKIDLEMFRDRLKDTKNIADRIKFIWFNFGDSPALFYLAGKGVDVSDPLAIKRYAREVLETLKKTFPENNWDSELGRAVARLFRKKKEVYSDVINAILYASIFLSPKVIPVVKELLKYRNVISETLLDVNKYYDNKEVSSEKWIAFERKLQMLLKNYNIIKRLKENPEYLLELLEKKHGLKRKIDGLEMRMKGNTIEVYFNNKLIGTVPVDFDILFHDIVWVEPAVAVHPLAVKIGDILNNNGLAMVYDRNGNLVLLQFTDKGAVILHPYKGRVIPYTNIVEFYRMFGGSAESLFKKYARKYGVVYPRAPFCIRIVEKIPVGKYGVVVCEVYDPEKDKVYYRAVYGGAEAISYDSPKEALYNLLRHGDVGIRAKNAIIDYLEKKYGVNLEKMRKLVQLENILGEITYEQPLFGDAVWHISESRDWAVYIGGDEKELEKVINDIKRKTGVKEYEPDKAGVYLQFYEVYQADLDKYGIPYKKLNEDVFVPIERKTISKLKRAGLLTELEAETGSVVFVNNKPIYVCPYLAKLIYKLGKPEKFYINPSRMTPIFLKYGNMIVAIAPYREYITE